MKKEDIYMKLFEFSRPTYYKWKREENKALKLISKYFEDKELIEFLESGKIERLEKSSQDINLEIFFADNAIFKISEIISNLSIQEIVESENLTHIDLSPEEAEEVKAMDWVMEWIKESETTDEFLEMLKKHNYTFLSIILNPLEIDGMIKNKQYVEDKIKKIDEMKMKRNQEKMALLESGLYFDDEVEIDDTVDDTDYDAEEKMRKDYMEMGLIEYEERNTLK